MSGNSGQHQDAWIAAWRYAAELHKDQQFSGTALPYIVHLGMVSMEILAAHAMAPLDDIALAMQCAALHDAMEDQGVSHAALAGRFGSAVADGVAALSKQSGLEKQAAMEDSLRRIRAQPAEVWCVKLADRISNLQPPPGHWSPEKIVRYREQAREILDALGAANTALAARLAEKIAAYPASA